MGYEIVHGIAFEMDGCVVKATMDGVVGNMFKVCNGAIKRWDK